MKASKNINTPPTRGNTNGMAETISSTGSWGWSSCCGAGLDMGVPKRDRFRGASDFTCARAWGSVMGLSHALVQHRLTCIRVMRSPGHGFGLSMNSSQPTALHDPYEPTTHAPFTSKPHDPGIGQQRLVGARASA